MSSHNNRLRRPMGNVNPANGIPLFADKGALLDNIPPSEKTCDGCKHWHHLEPNPAKPDVPNGECRESPHLFPVQTRQGLALQIMYAQTPAKFPACGRYQEIEPTPAKAV